MMFLCQLFPCKRSGHRLIFCRSLESSLCLTSSGRSVGSFPKQWLVIEPNQDNDLHYKAEKVHLLTGSCFSSNCYEGRIHQWGLLVRVCLLFYSPNLIFSLPNGSKPLLYSVLLNGSPHQCTCNVYLATVRAMMHFTQSYIKFCTVHF